ncbi:unnamed protein product [Caenorhabditis brenneri]
MKLILTPLLYTELKQHFMNEPDFKVAFIRYYRLEEFSAILGTDDVFFFHQSIKISKFVRLHRSKVPANVPVIEIW